MGFFLRIYMRVCKKERKYTWQENARISCSRTDCKYTWEKTARISCHNFETNGRPYLCPNKRKTKHKTAYKANHQLNLYRNPLLIYNRSHFAPNKQVEIQEGEGVEVSFSGPRGAANGLKIRRQYLGQKVSSRRQ